MKIRLFYDTVRIDPFAKTMEYDLQSALCSLFTELSYRIKRDKLELPFTLKLSIRSEDLDRKLVAEIENEQAE
jgi:hypothetical protein